ncbi:MAG: NUDIX domain-containing protein [Planctomycetota bacterium]|nr:NUDIX domain-containing protein [Planctomycetota bacterium]
MNGAARNLSPGAVKIAIAVVEWQSQFLVGTRASNQVLGGFHEFPGGKVRPQELPADAAIRECFEETGVVIQIKRLLQETYHEYGHDRLRLFFFAAQPAEMSDSPPRTQGTFRWLDRRELALCHFPDANQSLLRLLLDN